MSTQLNGSGRRVAIVTGASYGIGAASALALARAGCDVAITATNADNLAATAAAIAETGRSALPVVLDIRKQESIDACVAAVVARFGRVDILVNNAGTTLRRPAVDVSRTEWADLIDANVTGTFFVTQAVGRRMIADGTKGRIVFVGSSHAIVGASGQSTYGISKAAVTHMSRMLAIEWAPHGLTVNTVAPGRIVTASPARAANTADETYMEAMRSKIPLQRFATAEEVGETVAFLCGSGAGSITGQMVVVDGGLTAV